MVQGEGALDIATAQQSLRVHFGFHLGYFHIMGDTGRYDGSHSQEKGSTWHQSLYSGKQEARSKGETNLSADQQRTAPAYNW